jgi:hypothetical protein
MSDGLVFTCHGCGSTFAGFGISVGSVDPALGEPGDATAGEFCDACVATWRPVRAREELGRPVAQSETRNASLPLLEGSQALQACSECGTPFRPYRANSRYCSGGCRVRAHRRRRDEVPVINKTKES